MCVCSQARERVNKQTLKIESYYLAPGLGPGLAPGPHAVTNTGLAGGSGCGSPSHVNDHLSPEGQSVVCKKLLVLEIQAPGLAKQEKVKRVNKQMLKD